MPKYFQVVFRGPLILPLFPKEGVHDLGHEPCLSGHTVGNLKERTLGTQAGLERKKKKQNTTDNVFEDLKKHL